MRVSEKILVVIGVIGLLFKLCKYPGSGPLLIVSLGSLSMLYFLSFMLFNRVRLRDLFKDGAFKNTPTSSIIIAIFLGFTLSVSLLGILFKIQLYPGAGIMTLMGIALPVIPILCLMIISKSEDPIFFKEGLIRTVVISVLALILYLTPAIRLVDYYYGETHPEYIKLYKQHLEDPTNERLLMKLDIERMKLYEPMRK